MKNWKIVAITLAALALPMAALAGGVEFSVGAWYVDPSGRIAYNPEGPRQFFSLSSTAGVDEEWQATFRLKAQAPKFPGIYLQAAPLSFSSDGDSGFEFSFGDLLVNEGDTIDSDFFLNIYDGVLYLPFPLYKDGDRDVVNLELGAGARWITIRAELEAQETDGLLTTAVLDDAQTENAIYPEGYAALHIRPMDMVALEGEFWGYSWNGDKFWSLIGRLKIIPIKPLFISGGYRYDFYDFDQDDLALRDAHFKGPFAELGVQW